MHTIRLSMALLVLTIAALSQGNEEWFARVCKRTPGSLATHCVWALVEAPLRVAIEDSGAARITADVVTELPATPEIHIAYVVYSEEQIMVDRTQPVPNGIQDHQVVRFSHAGIELRRVTRDQLAGCSDCYALLDGRLTLSPTYALPPTDVAFAFVLTYAYLKPGATATP